MQIDTQAVLDMAERSGKIAFLDLESTGLRGDYNSILVGSIKPYNRATRTFLVTQPGDDREVVAAIRDELEKYWIWVTYYGKGFDLPLLKTRLVFNNERNVDPRHHLDMYWHLKYHLLTARRSQSHLLTWLGTPEQKMTLSPDEWNRVLRDPPAGLAVLRKRCESDVRGLASLYKRTRHLVVNITK